VVASILIFVVVKALVGILGSIVGNIIYRARLLGGADRLTGLILGAAGGVVLVFFLVTVLVPMGVTFSNEGLIEALHHSAVVDFVVNTEIYQTMREDFMGNLAGFYAH